MKRIIGLIVLAMVVTACGNAVENLAEQAAEEALESEGVGGNVDIEMGEDGEGSIVVETEEGTQSVDFGSGELPEELTIPVMDGYEVVGSSVASGDQVFVTAQLQYADTSVEELAAFYEDYFSGVDGVNTTQSESGGIQSFTWSTESEQVAVTEFAEDGPAMVQVTQTG